MARFYDAHRIEAPLYKVGHQDVDQWPQSQWPNWWRNYQQMAQTIFNWKGYLWNAYRLNLPHNSANPPGIFSPLLRPYNTDTISQMHTTRSPSWVIKDEKRVWSRTHFGQLNFRISWISGTLEGYGVEEMNGGQPKNQSSRWLVLEFPL